MANYTYELGLTPTVNQSTGNITFTSETLVINTKDKYVLENIEVSGHAGQITPSSFPQGTLSNQGNSGVTYTPNTAAATVIPAEGSLYINAGWFPNTVISLGHMIPDDTDYANAGNSNILSGFEAYDTDGKKLIGTIATKDGFTTTSGNNAKILVGGGAVSVTPSITDYTAPSVKHTPTGKFLPSGTGNVGATYGVALWDDNNPPEGTEGEKYLTIDCYHTYSEGSVKAYATASRTAVTLNEALTHYADIANGTTISAQASNNATSVATTITPTISDEFQKMYIPIVSPKGTGGTVSKAASGSSATATISLTDAEIAHSGKFTETTSGGAGATYGVIKGTPTSGDGVDGTDYLKITTSGGTFTATASGTATIKYNRAAVTSDGTYKGAVNIASGDTLLNALSTPGSLTHTIDGTQSGSVIGGETYWIKIVHPEGKGGAVSKASSGSSATAAISITSAAISTEGEFTKVGSGQTGALYGVRTTQPSGSDGTNYLMIKTGGSVSASASGTAIIAYNRAAVLSNATYQGAVNIAEDSSLLAADSGSLTQAITGSVSGSSMTGGSTYYIPIVKATFSGGEVSATAGGSESTAVTVKYKTNASGKDSGGNSVTLSNYGVTADNSGTTTPDGYVVFASTARQSAAGSVRATADATRGKVLYSNDAGAILAHTDTIAKPAENATQDTHSVVTSASIAGEDTYRYKIPIVEPTVGVSYHNITSPTVTISQTIKYQIGNTPQTMPSGFVTSVAALGNDLSNGYITISPDSSSSNGSSKTKGTASISAGITSEHTNVLSAESSQPISANVQMAQSYSTYYVKVFDPNDYTTN